MFRKIILIAILLGSTPLWASLFGDDEKEIVISTHIIHISGEEYFTESDMYDALGIEHKNFFQFWKDDLSRIHDKLLPTLSASLRAFYDSEGFYDATYTIKETNTTVTVEVTENEPVKVSDINISSDYDISSLVTFEKGEIFQAKKFISIKGHIIASLLKNGYCSYELDSKAYVDLEKHSVDLHYSVKKGGVCTFGNVTINGNKSIDEDVIRSRVRAAAGERFSTELVKDTSDAIYGLRSFDSVLIGVDRKFYNVIPVDITVKEMEKPYHFEAGAGFDTYVGPRVHSSLAKHNFLGDAQELKLQLAWSKLEQLAVLSFYRPVLFKISDYYIGIGGRIGYSNLEFDGFQEEKTFMRAYLDYQSERTKLRAGWAFENINITALDNLRPGEDPKFAVNEGTFLLTYPYVDFTYDARNSKLNPTSGYYIHAYGELGLSDAEDGSVYYKTLLEGRFIHSFGNLTLAAVGIVGVVDEESEKSLPESKYFFAGGSFSNRAYGFRELGVILSPTEDSINGASTWANLSLEADYPVWGDLYGAVFTDNTMLTDTAYDFKGEVITSAGVGVRYMTPIGPFKLDVGMNVADPSQYGISFQIGQSF
ncbi:MAG: outer membrane protein assembly factor [Epsilonproteobacteria bacterium]|nr:MAG: outer membrane protein assembly factor [Campylobacterota bacterium]